MVIVADETRYWPIMLAAQRINQRNCNAAQSSDELLPGLEFEVVWFRMLCIFHASLGIVQTYKNTGCFFQMIYCNISAGSSINNARFGWRKTVELCGCNMHETEIESLAVDGNISVKKESSHWKYQ
jgi:hypothetical protein